jgi:hypothetical protein
VAIGVVVVGKFSELISTCNSTQNCTRCACAPLLDEITQCITVSQNECQLQPKLCNVRLTRNSFGIPLTNSS